MIDLAQFEGHTPGPWKVWTPEEWEEVYGSSWLRPIVGTVEDEPWSVCEVSEGQPGESGQDAKLLAAAPDLLALAREQAKTITEKDAEIERLRGILEPDGLTAQYTGESIKAKNARKCAELFEKHALREEE